MLNKSFDLITYIFLKHVIVMIVILENSKLCRMFLGKNILKGDSESLKSK